MRQCLRFVFAIALPLPLAVCSGDGRTDGPTDPSIELSAVADLCPTGAIIDDITALFPTDEALLQVATVKCGQIFDAFGKGNQTQAIRKAFAFFQKTLKQNEAGKLLDPDPSAEAVIVDLFSDIFAAIGLPLPEIDPEVLMDGEYAIGTIVPNGKPLLTISKHAGIGPGGEGLFAPVSVFIVQIFAESGPDLELSSAEHPCPSGVDNSFDCYPLFYDYSVFPESNVNTAVGLQLGQCNVSPEGVEVQLLSPEGFLPLDAAPAGIDCSDVNSEEVAMTGWRARAWTVLEPIAPLLRVTPAIAGESPIGGRISNFSPVAPADPESGEQTLGSISGHVFNSSTEASIQGATVDLFRSDETFVESTTTNADGNYTFPDLDLGSYFVTASAPGFSSGGSGVVDLTEESPGAENVNIGLTPIIIID